MELLACALSCRAAGANYPEWQSRNRSNLGFQPDRSCRLPSLLVRDQAGCPFDETGRMPVLLATRLHQNLRKLRQFSSIVVRASRIGGCRGSRRSTISVSAISTSPGRTIRPALRPSRCRRGYGIIRLRNVTTNQRGEIVQTMLASAMVPKRKE